MVTVLLLFQKFMKGDVESTNVRFTHYKNSTYSPTIITEVRKGRYTENECKISKLLKTAHCNGNEGRNGLIAVSYTHLTLPTNAEV